MNNILEWLEQSADRYPEKTAFASVESELTYTQLVQRAKSIGTYLSSRIAPRTPVALYLVKECTAISAMLGAVYAGCFYCVLDVRQPAQRLENIVSTLQPGIVLTDRHFAEEAAERFANSGFEPVCIEDIWDEAIDEEKLAAIRAQALDIDPLYVNFTSGSTGNPKGVVVGHRSVIDFIPSFVEIFGITADDQIANQAPFDFDVSVKDIYSSLCAGATVHMIPREYFSVPTQLMDFLCERKATVCTWAVSAMCFVSIMNGFEYRVPDTIKKVMFSGEVMPPKQLNKWRKYLPECRFANVYGPTEVTCNCTYYFIDREFDKREVIPMGKAFPNEKVFLLDEDDKLVTEPGVEGEICVSGTTLALGYLNDPERTAAAFVQNPLHTSYLETIYRTGDLAKYDENGDFVYISRKDFQIKHMGQRIELGEIEMAAQADDGVTRACCIYNQKKKRILLFYTGTTEKDTLVAELAERLPQYMVPNKTTHIDEMPLTKNGKIDRNALAAL